MGDLCSTESVNLGQWTQEVLTIRESVLCGFQFLTLWDHFLDLSLASSATYFIALAQKPDRLSDSHNLAQCAINLDTLNEFLPTEVDRIRILASTAERLCIDGVAYVIVSALVSMARSLLVLINSGRLTDDQSRSAETLLVHLSVIFDEQEPFSEGQDLLRSFKAQNSLSGELSSLPNLPQ